ncbi:hypothetical protein FQN54_007651 [Arachnomyces sp. PD_36]|nr:hypothetical protein FQN54_007651 [Arachnomyces sp. PD_36]
MLSRSSSDANFGLRRAKSSSSVQRRRNATVEREPSNPEVTRQHALTAASRAMQRAEERSSTESRGSYDIPRNDSRVSGRHFPPRPQSIRFIDNEGSIGPGSIRYLSPAPPPSTANSVINDVPTPETVRGLPQISELGTIEDGIASTPSSYRKLRRAKSMFSTRQRSMEGNRQVSDASDEGASHMGVLRRSISFMRGGGGQSLRRSKSQTAAVQLAREQFLQDLARQSQLEQTLPRKPKREHKPFNKTVRNSRLNSSDMSSSSAGRFSANEGRFGAKARIFSLSIKKGLKRVFRRSSANQGGIHSLQLSGVSYEDYNRPQSGMGLDIQDFPAQDFTQHQGDHSSSGEGYPGMTESIADRPRSLRTISSDSLDGTSSRVSSWADSTAHQIPARQSSDRNRLSIIQEHGGQIPSHSLVQTSSKGGYAVFSKPLRTSDGSDDMLGSVDSQRVFSALRKRIDGNRALQRAEDSGSIRFRPRAISPPERASSIYSNRTCHTIRPVPSELSIKSVKSMIRTRPRSVQSQTTIRAGYPGDENGLTPQQIAHENERIARRRSKQSVRDVNSPFFSPISNKKNRTPSPIKGKKLSREPQFNSEDDSGSIIVSRPPYSEYGPVSPSVYSRTTDSDTPKRTNYDIHMDTPLAESSEEERGTATILASHRLPYHPSVGQASRCSSERPVKASADWKIWMDSQMNGLDGQDAGNSQYTKPNHFRENAQIGEEDEELGKRPFIQRSTGHDNGSVFDASEPQQMASCESEARNPLAELKTLPQNNFSRPLRRSPNPSIPELSPLFQKSSDMPQTPSKPTDIGSDSLQPRTKESPRSGTLASSQHSSPWIPSKRSQSNLPEESTPKDRSGSRQTVSLRGHYGSTPTKYSRDITRPDPTRFSSVRTRERSGRVTNENVRVEQSYPADDEASNQAKPGDPLYSATSSKRMVDLFLSSRRRQMGASEGSTSEPAFL